MQTVEINLVVIYCKSGIRWYKSILLFRQFDIYMNFMHIPCGIHQSNLSIKII